MDKTIKKTPSRNRLSLMLKLGSGHAPPTTDLDVTTAQASASTSSASPISANASPSSRTHRPRASVVFSNSPLSSVPQSPASEPAVANMASHGSLSLPRKVRRLSDAFLWQTPEVIAAGEGTSAHHNSPSDMELGIAAPALNLSSKSLSLPSRGKRIRRGSSARALLRVKSFILPHPALPEMKPRPPKVQRYASASLTSLARPSASATPSIAEDVFAEAREQMPSMLSLDPLQCARNPSLLEPASPIYLNSPGCSIEEYPIFQDASHVSPGRGDAEKRKRRMSFDFASLAHQPLVAPPSATPPGKRGLGRSRTINSPRDRMQREQEEMADQTEKALKVRRAHKMLTLFGAEPPFSLYHQGGESPEKAEEDMLLMPPTVRNARQRESLTTIVSLASLELAHRRSSSASTTAGSPTKATSPSPPSPLPVDVTTRRSSDPLIAATPPTSPIDPTVFTTTRRRGAAKLARFFGVGHREAFSAGTSPAHKASASESTSRTAPVSPGVNVQVSSPSRFWGRRHTSQDVNMDDVMGRLRNMKASR
ncbi:hypothetical protein FIBSPDRAFT_898495 [Athelia psychrophila]|uniref:Uncharacterized protein n=1 Tax=Athelia psychrophila TaxID=1759441 RepID=A0A166AW29_9AGAM|nr:hypothetical protein FIBSPDRAFT_898495 [Fibularhizoctonia sp. CBS 109695]